jgi:DNA segregation ATPase FtsK/SpoIIIE, S-DNA-T family
VASKGKSKKTKKKKTNSARIQNDDRIKIIIGLVFLASAFLILLALISYIFTWKIDQSFLWNPNVVHPDVRVENWAGKLGARIAIVFMNRWFGLASFTFPFLLIVIGFRFFRLKLLPLRKTLIVTLILTLLLSTWLGLFTNEENLALGSGLGGGHGYYLSQLLTSLLGKIGAVLFLFILSFSLFILSVNKSLKQLRKAVYSFTKFRFLKNKDIEFHEEEQPDSDNEEISADDGDLVFETEFPSREKYTVKNKPEEEDIKLTIEEKKKEESSTHNSMPFDKLEDYDPTLELESYRLPPIDLLEEHNSGDASVTNEELISNKNKIVETLGHYKIQIDKIKATIGPTVTLYEIVPAPGIRISKIKNLEDDIALNLSALGIRIIAPIPGRGTIGIEVPNQSPEIVSMRSLITSRKFQESKYELAIALGKTISNETYVFDLTRMPHLLVAGATGQGKSVGLNAIITSLLYKKHPSQLKLVLVDPKKVELTLYARIEKHYLAKLPDDSEAIVTDTRKVIETLHSLTTEMDGRYDLLKKAQVRNIKEYNEKFIKRKLNPEKGHRFMPYIVIVIDEFADLIMTAGREVETPLARLAQLARAIGIHLVIATQRPTTNIITGVIKANFPARIAFRVSSMIDSRTILDTPGANQLIGRGDLLFAPGSDLIRLQCAFIDIPELERITEFIGSQRGYTTPWYLPEYIDDNAPEMPGEVDLTKKDNLFNDAARVIVAHQQGSTSLIQRKFSIGYNRAGKIIDQLEAAGIVGPYAGSKARDVLIPDEYTLEQYLNSLE